MILVRLKYHQFIQQVEDLTTRLSQYYSQHLVCRRGCSGCCYTRLSVFEVEAASLRAAIRELPVEIRRRIEQQALDVSEDGRGDASIACPLLVEDQCSVYHSRPVICRTQGLPLLFEAGEEQVVDFCPLNFTGLDATDDLEEDHLVALDELNLKLALINLQHCLEQGMTREESGRRIGIRELILSLDD
jgi:uncharacterized protein